MALKCECCEELVRPRDLVHIADPKALPSEWQVYCDPCWNEMNNSDGYCTRPGTIGYMKANRPAGQ